MNEKLLQYLWNHKIFKSLDFKDTEGNSIEIIDFGTFNPNSGPDFQMAKIKLGNLTLVGNIELHIKASDWQKHQHSGNPNFENLILHVVYENDSEIPHLTHRNIPTLELKNYIDKTVINNYQNILESHQKIPCEAIFDETKIPFGFYESMLLKKLDEKSLTIENDLAQSNNDYEAVLFHYMAYAFGLKINSPIFKQMAESIPFNTFQKISKSQLQSEALFFGLSNWLNEPLDEEMTVWKREFEFISNKFQLTPLRFNPKFLRLRPHNFPTIRLSQLSNLYYQAPNLFSKIINAKTYSEVFKIFENITANDYWDNHYSFGKPTDKTQKKTLSKNFINLILINAILPIKYTYHKYRNEDTADELVSFYTKIPSESNSILTYWKQLGVATKNALESQALLYQTQNFCKAKKCLNCSIGLQLLKQ